MVTLLLESSVIAGVLAVEIVTEPAGVMVMFPGVPPDAAEVLSAPVVAADTVRSSAKLGAENAAAMALDNNTWRIFKINPLQPLFGPEPAAPQKMDAEDLISAS